MMDTASSCTIAVVWSWEPETMLQIAHKVLKGLQQALAEVFSILFISIVSRKSLWFGVETSFGFIWWCSRIGDFLTTPLGQGKWTKNLESPYYSNTDTHLFSTYFTHSGSWGQGSQIAIADFRPPDTARANVGRSQSRGLCRWEDLAQCLGPKLSFKEAQ